MSEVVLSILISIVILLALAAWVPFLHLCHGCVSRWRDRPRLTQAAENKIDPIAFEAEE